MEEFGNNFGLTLGLMLLVIILAISVSFIKYRSDIKKGNCPICGHKLETIVTEDGDLGRWCPNCGWHEPTK